MPDEVLRCVEKAFAVVEAFDSRGAAPVGVGELARRAGLAKSTAYRMLKVLHGLRVVEKWNGKYTLSARLAALGEAASGYPPKVCRGQLQPWLQELHGATRGVARATMLYGRTEVCIGLACDHDTVDVAVSVDDHRPAPETASGRVILAFSSPFSRVRASNEYRTSPVDSSVKAGRLHRELSRINRVGWAYEYGFAHRPVLTIAAPVLNEDGEAFAALAVTDAFARGQAGKIASLVVEAAREASRAISATPQSGPRRHQRATSPSGNPFLKGSPSTSA